MQELGNTTGYGSAWELREAVSHLRARASRFGAELHPANQIDPIDAAAAVIGTDAWMFALQASELDRPSRFGAPAVQALARLLARSAGFTAEEADLDDLPEALEQHLVRAELYVGWVERLDLDVSEVLWRAASDIAVGADNERLGVMASALLAQVDG